MAIRFERALLGLAEQCDCDCRDCETRVIYEKDRKQEGNKKSRAGERGMPVDAAGEIPPECMCD